MEKIKNYILHDVILAEEDKTIYRAVNDINNNKVIIKLLNPEYSPAQAIFKFKNELEIGKKINIEGLIKPISVETIDSHTALIAGNIEGSTLLDYIENNNLSVQTKLIIAEQLSLIIGEIHKQNIIIRNLNSRNILFNDTTNKVTIIDLNLASEVANEQANFSLLSTSAYNLAYISPEQTGRINRTVDYRTDLYSLGIILYELFTKKQAFCSDEMIDMVYSHIAKTPVAPLKIDNLIPEVISDIILKLLSKDPESRYQNAFGLKDDINKCLALLNKNQKIEYFQIAQNDISDKFQISQKIYGREKETDILLSTYERVSNGGKEILLVSGRPGIGKTVLINEIHKPVIKQKGILISGKYEQFNRDVPYSGIIQAFKELIINILTESDQNIKSWKQKISEAIGSNGQILIDVIPELEHVIGKQPEVSELDPNETQNRFKITFTKFIQVFASKEHPLVVFCDDMQWSDTASMKLIEDLIYSFDTLYILLLFAYRETEVAEGHPFIISVNSMKEQEITINNVILEPLEPKHAKELIGDSLKNRSDEINELTDIVYLKTRGNPFFIYQFLKNLHDEKFLNFNYKNNTWNWEIDQIKQKNYTDNVVKFLIEKLQKLTDIDKEILKKASIIGNQFDLKTLSIVIKKSIEETSNNLSAILKNGLIILMDQIYDKDNNGDRYYNEIYKFSHDQIQKAAYSLIDDEEKVKLHFETGRLLIKNYSWEEQKEKIFDIIYQLNQGVELITDQEEKDDLAKLNLLAGKKAKVSIAYLQALNNFLTGIKLIGENSWQRVYDLTKDLYIEAAEAAYLVSDFDEMMKLTDFVIENSKDLLDKIKAYKIRIQSAKSQNNMPKALDLGLEILKLMGYSFPVQAKKHHVLLGLIKLKMFLSGKKVENFSKLPKMTDPKQRAAINILANILPAAYVSRPEILPLLAFKQVYISVKYGNANPSSYAYAVYGFILIAALGDIEGGFKFGELASELANKFDNIEYKARTLQVTSLVIDHWKKHVKEIIPLFKDAYQYALEAGDLEYFGNNIWMHTQHQFYIGGELKRAENELDKSEKTLVNFHQISNINYVKANRFMVRSLLNDSINNNYPPNEFFNEKETVSVYKEGKDNIGFFYLHVFKAIIDYSINESYKDALKNLDEAKKYIETPQGMFIIPVYYLYDSLSRLAVLPEINKSEQKQYLKIITSNQKKYNKWAKSAPMNYLHKYYLVEAEKYNVQNNNVKAKEYYEKAIEYAKKNEYINEEGLANELYGKYLVKNGDKEKAKSIILQAINCYSQWGANALVEKLNNKYDELLVVDKEIQAKHKGSKRGKTDQIDVISIIRASQALSEELKLSELLKKLLKITIENVGATKGILLLEKSGEIFIEAESDSSTQQISVLKSIPLEKSESLSQSVVNYVIRTKIYIVLNNASKEGDFIDDRYVSENQLKSVLCVPIIYKTQLTGIIYFENSIITNAFTPERVELIKLLTSQIAISIENAFFYKDLENKVKERTSEIIQQKEEIISQRDEIEAQRDRVTEQNLELEQYRSHLEKIVDERTGQLKKAKEKAEESDKLKSAFLANMSHEIRTPLNAIIGFSNLLVMDDLSEESPDELVEHITKNANSLVQLIDDIIDISKIEAGQLSINKSDCNVNVLLDELYRTFHEIITRTNLNIELKLNKHRPDSNFIIYSDFNRLRQILSNLIDNAVKFTEKGLVEFGYYYKSNSELLFYVKDTGIGIEKTKLKIIFERFLKIEDRKTKFYKGVGLGLSITRALVEALDGKIWVESTLGKGSVFNFILPVNSIEESIVATEKAK